MRYLNDTGDDRALSGAFHLHERLAMVGFADDPRGGTHIAIAHLGSLDGVFRNGLDAPVTAP